MTVANKKLNLLSLDGGGIRGLSTLYILKQVMETVNPDCPPKPCEYFDMVCGTGSGGLISIMLGRLDMGVDQCIDAYRKFSKRVLCSDTRLPGIKTMCRSSNAARLEQVLGDMLKQQGYDERTPFRDVDTPCRVFTCLTNREGKNINLATYSSGQCPLELYSSTTIWEAGRASLASAFDLDGVDTSSTGQGLFDNTKNSNNPIQRLWAEARIVWPEVPLKSQLGCVISIGTGVPSVQRFNTSIPGMIKTLRKVSADSEATANMFIRENTDLDDDNRYFRFNVPNGLADIRPNEVDELDTIVCATQDYISQELVHKYIRKCARSLGTRQGYQFSTPAPLPSTKSAWELPGAMRSQTGLYSDNDSRNLEHKPSVFHASYELKEMGNTSSQSPPRTGKFLGLFGSKKTPVVV